MSDDVTWNGLVQYLKRAFRPERTEIEHCDHEWGHWHWRPWSDGQHLSPRSAVSIAVRRKRVRHCSKCRNTQSEYAMFGHLHIDRSDGDAALLPYESPDELGKHIGQGDGDERESLARNGPGMDRP